MWVRTCLLAPSACHGHDRQQRHWLFAHQNSVHSMTPRSWNMPSAQISKAGLHLFVTGSAFTPCTCSSSCVHPCGGLFGYRDMRPTRSQLNLTPLDCTTFSPCYPHHLFLLSPVLRCKTLARYSSSGLLKFHWDSVSCRSNEEQARPAWVLDEWRPFDAITKQAFA